MIKPAIVIVDDFPQVLQKLKNDLEQKYSDHFRIIGANSGQQALDQLKQMNLHNEPVALLLVDKQLPVVIFPGGSYLVNPTELQIAEKINLKTHVEKPFYDLIITGSGPAGLAAGVYGASEGLCTLLVEQEAPGGQAGTSSRIENYLGFPSGVSGGELARRAVTQAERFGAEIVTPQKAVRVFAPG
jgi:thioredoxin reductase (NADPH)